MNADHIERLAGLSNAFKAFGDGPANTADVAALDYAIERLSVAQGQGWVSTEIVEALFTCQTKQDIRRTLSRFELKNQGSSLVHEAADAAWEAYAEHFSGEGGLSGPIDSEMIVLAARLKLYLPAAPAQPDGVE